MPPLMRVEGQRLAVAFDRAADRAQFDAAGKRAAQRLKRDAAAPALQQSGAERLGRVVPRGADRKRKGRRKIERVEADFALDVPFAIKRHREAPAQPRARYRAVEIVESQLAAFQRHARGQADVLRQRVGRLEIEQRREIDAANASRLTLALASCAHGSAVPCASASSPAPDSLAFSRSGARQTPVTDPSNCAGPSPAAIARSSPSSASSARPCPTTVSIRC